MLDLEKILSGEPAYRLKQIYTAWFDLSIKSYAEITTLSKELRQKLSDYPWLVVQPKKILKSKLDGTRKALLQLSDGPLRRAFGETGAVVETVLMGRENKKLPPPPSTPPSPRRNSGLPRLLGKAGEAGRAGGEGWRAERLTVCISTQVGCPMNCAFCATGKMGFKRNLTAYEIVDQVRFWNSQLEVPPNKGGRGVLESGEVSANTPLPLSRGDLKVSNIVLMGQGEPLLNYDNVKEALNILIKYGGVGQSKITLSTAGVQAGMEKILEDRDWPAVRFALSLHSAIDATRAQIMPTHRAGFFDWLIEWSKKYHARFPARTQFIGLEYTLLKGINDDDKHLRALIKLASKLGRVRINLIPFNTLSFRPNPERSEGGAEESLNTRSAKLKGFLDSPSGLTRNDKTIDQWHQALLDKGFITTTRQSQGQDIAAACGQLATKG